MKDMEIISLFHKRMEQAIYETEKKYGVYCHRIASNILSIKEDAEECVNDTYLSAWNSMPPAIPKSLKTFLGCITRNLSISRYRANHAKKRYAGMELLLSELEDCIPTSKNNIDEMIDLHVLSEIISDWLDTLSSLDRALFVRRYWYGDTIATLAAESGYSSPKLTQKMLRLRRKLKKYLEQEGVNL